MGRRYVTPLGEHILEYGSTEESVAEVPPYVDWVGPAPRLATADAATSYLHIDQLQTSYALPSAAIELLRLPDFTDAIIHVQIRVESSAATFSSDAYVFDDAGNNAFAAVTGPTNEWVTVSGPLEVLSGDLVPSIAPIYAVVVGPFFDSDADRWDVSWLAVSEEGDRPLRWRQRNDGLGGSSPRAARGVTSQQGSNRHRGYL